MITIQVLAPEDRKELKLYLKERKASGYYCRILVGSAPHKEISIFIHIFPQSHEPNHIRKKAQPFTCDYMNIFINLLTDISVEKDRRNNKGGALYLCSYWFQSVVLTQNSKSADYVLRKRMKMANVTVGVFYAK